MDEISARVVRIEGTLRRSRKVYMALAALELLNLISLGWDDQVAVGGRVETLLMMFVNITIYLGLKRRKSWVVELVLILSAWWIFRTIVQAFEPSSDLLGVLRKFFGYLLGLFFLHQIFFFKRKDVRKFFGSEGRALFC